MGVSAERSRFMADAIEDRRNELHLDPGELVRRVGKSAQAVLNLRKGLVRNYSTGLKREMCRALKWSPDSIDRLLSGEPPIQRQPVADDLGGLGDRLEARLEAIAARVDALERRVS